MNYSFNQKISPHKN